MASADRRHPYKTIGVAVGDGYVIAPAALSASTAQRLLELARVLEIVRTYPRRFDSIEQDAPLSEGARMLRIVADHAEDALRDDPGAYDPELLAAFARSCS